MRYAVSSIYSLNRLTHEDMVEMTDKALLSTARFSRRAVMGIRKDLYKNNAQYTLSELNLTDPVREVSKKMDRSALMEIIAENQQITSSEIRYATNAKKREAEFQRIVESTPYLDEGTLRKALSEKSWMEIGKEITVYESGQIYKYIVSSVDKQEFIEKMVSLMEEREAMLDKYGIRRD